MIIYAGLRLVIVIFMLFSTTNYSNDAPTNIVINFGATLQLDCTSKTLDTFHVVWKHGDERIMVHDRKQTIEKQSKGFTSRFLTERNIYQLHKIINGIEDLGSYVCLQIPSTGTPQTTAWNLLSGYFSYPTDEGNATTEIGGTVILECSSKTSIPVSIEWKHDGVRILQHQADHSFQQSEEKYIPKMVSGNMTAQLEIRDVTLEDAGNYSCFLSDGSGNSFKTSWTLHVTEGSIHDVKISAPVGTSMSLPCSLFSPSSIVTAVVWYRGSNEILHHNTRKNSTSKGKYTSIIAYDKSVATLEIQVVGFDDAGKYSCSAFFQKGQTLQSNWMIRIQGKHDIEAKIFLFVGDATRLKCNVDKSANESYRWTHDSEVVNDSVNNSEKIIVNASFKDAGIYSCFSYSSKNGNIQTRWKLQIQGNVHVTLSKSLSLENDTLLSKCCVAFGLEPEKLKIEWLVNGKISHFNYSTHNFTEENKTRMFCSNLTLSVSRSYHGQSLDCLVQDHRNTSTSALLHVLYSPKILTIKRHPSSHASFPSLLSNKDDFLTCSVDANPRPEVRLEKKSASGNWKHVPLFPHFNSSNRTIYEWRFPLWSIDKGSYRCSAYNEYGNAAPSLEIDIECVWFCIFDSPQGFVLTFVICVGVIVVIALIIKIVIFVKEKCLRYNVSTDSERAVEENLYERPIQVLAKAETAQTNKQTETVLLDTIYEHPSDVHTTGQEERQISGGPTYELIEEKNYSLVTRERGYSPYEKMNRNPVYDNPKTNAIYTTVEKDKSVTPDPCKTVQKGENNKTKPHFSSSNGDEGTSTNLTKAELMYAKGKKNEIWTTKNEFNVFPLYASAPDMNRKVTAKNQYRDLCTLIGNYSNTSLGGCNDWSAQAEDDSQHSDIYLTPDVNSLKL